MTSKLKVPKDLFTISFFLFFVLNLLSAFWANNVSLVWQKSAMWFVLFTIYINIRSLDVNNFNYNFWKCLFIGVILLNLILIFWSFYLVVFNEAGEFLLSYDTIISSPGLFKANGNAVSSTMLLLLSILLVGTESKSWNKQLIYLLIPTIIFLILIYNSRGSSIGLILLLAIFAFRYFKNKKSLFILYSFSAILISFVCITYFLLENPSRYFGLYNPMRTVLEDTSDDRLHMWRNSLKLFSDTFPLGVGSGNWIVEIYRYGYNDFGFSTYTHAHNFFFETIAELGVVGGVITLILLFYPIFIHLKSAKTNPFLFYPVMFSIGFAVVTSFYGVVYLDYRMMSLWAGVMGCFFSQYDGEKNESIFANLLLCFLLCSSILYVGLRNHSYCQYRKIPRLNKEEKILTYNAIIKPNLIEYFHGNYLISDRVSLTTKENPKEAYESIKIAVEKNPYNLKTLYLMGRHYEVRKNFAAALNYYKKAIQLNTHHFNSYLGIMRISNRKKFWNEFDFSTSIFENVVIPVKEKYYKSDDLLESQNHAEKVFWRRRCALIDQYYRINVQRMKYAKKYNLPFDQQNN